MPETTITPAGHFSQMLSTAMSQKGLSTKQLSEQLEISYEHARRLQNNEALPSRHLAKEVARYFSLDFDAVWQAAQRDKIQRKFGTHLLAESTGTTDRVENFAPLINSLLPEQVPHAMAMLSGLVAAARMKAATAPVLPVVKALKPVLTAAHKRKMRGEPEPGV